jgi:predicted nucleic acid-binding protein
MKRRVYIETSIPSFYHETRTEPEMIARRDWTRQWWADAPSRYELVTSAAVVDELRRGEYPNKEKCLQLIQDIRLITSEPEIFGIVQTYIAHHVMPNDPVGDALHLAFASHYKCDFLVTWNCRHLANANKFGHIRTVNNMLGLFVPALVTPLELLGDQDEAR